MTCASCNSVNGCALCNYGFQKPPTSSGAGSPPSWSPPPMYTPPVDRGWSTPSRGGRSSSSNSTASSGGSITGAIAALFAMVVVGGALLNNGPKQEGTSGQPSSALPSSGGGYSGSSAPSYTPSIPYTSSDSTGTAPPIRLYGRSEELTSLAPDEPYVAPPSVEEMEHLRQISSNTVPAESLTLASGTTGRIFTNNDVDVYIRTDGYSPLKVFFGRQLNFGVDHIEYHRNERALVVVTTQGQRYDLGIRIGDEVDRYLSNATDAEFYRTQNKQPRFGFKIPIYQSEMPRFEKDSVVKLSDRQVTIKNRHIISDKTVYDCTDMKTVADMPDCFVTENLSVTPSNILPAFLNTRIRILADKSTNELVFAFSSLEIFDIKEIQYKEADDKFHYLLNNGQSAVQARAAHITPEQIFAASGATFTRYSLANNTIDMAGRKPIQWGVFLKDGSRALLPPKPTPVLVPQQSLSSSANTVEFNKAPTLPVTEAPEEAKILAAHAQYLKLAVVDGQLRLYETSVLSNKPFGQSISHLEYTDGKLFVVTPDDNGLQIPVTDDKVKSHLEYGKNSKNGISIVGTDVFDIDRELPGLDDSTRHFRVNLFYSRQKPEPALTIPESKHGPRLELRHRFIIEGNNKRTWSCGGFVNQKRDDNNPCFATDNIIVPK